MEAFSAVYELRTDLSAPVALRLFAGPGVYFGMHAGHMHPTTRGREVYRDAPWTQLYPMAGGIGRLAIQSIYNRDYPIVQCTVFLSAILFIVLNFAIDLFYGVLDPRVRPR